MSGTGVVGRDSEMAAVAAFLDAVRSGPCGLVLEGAAGIGGVVSHLPTRPPARAGGAMIVPSE